MKYKIHPKFEELLEKNRTCLTWFARDAGIPLGTLRAALRPEQHRGRKGFVRGYTAHRIADAYAQLAGISKDDAWKEIFGQD